MAGLDKGWAATVTAVLLRTDPYVPLVASLILFQPLSILPTAPLAPAIQGPAPQPLIRVLSATSLSLCWQLGSLPWGWGGDWSLGKREASCVDRQAQGVLPRPLPLGPTVRSHQSTCGSCATPLPPPLPFPSSYPGIYQLRTPLQLFRHLFFAAPWLFFVILCCCCSC